MGNILEIIGINNMAGRKHIRQMAAYLLLCLTLGVLAACGDGERGETGETGQAQPGASRIAEDAASTLTASTPTSAPSPSPQPTPTPQLAALVNGQPILLEEYERELARFKLAQAELGNDLKASEREAQARVLNALIEQELIRQAAVVEGIVITPETVEAKMGELREATNAQGGLDAWLAENLFSEEAFKKALTEELMAEQLVAIITADVPVALEQVHVRYIQVDDLARAETILNQIREGSDFAALAQRYSLDQATAPYGGDLGYFARGSLLVPEIEDAAFELQLDEVSDIISVTDEDSGAITYYIVKLLERDPERILGADLRHRLLQEAFDSWLEQQLESAQIVNFLEDQG
jgi:parvulin-like peptidyl-prolyl isomerase